MSDDIVERLRAVGGPQWLSDLALEAASEIEHFRTVYGHITPDQAAKIKQFQISARIFDQHFPSGPTSALPQMQEQS